MRAVGFSRSRRIRIQRASGCDCKLSSRLACRNLRLTACRKRHRTERQERFGRFAVHLQFRNLRRRWRRGLLLRLLCMFFRRHFERRGHWLLFDFFLLFFGLGLNFRALRERPLSSGQLRHLGFREKLRSVGDRHIPLCVAVQIGIAFHSDRLWCRVKLWHRGLRCKQRTRQPSFRHLHNIR